MNYSKYQYVIMVAEMQSISKAAKELYMSQPALTKYINKLEEEIGVKLFKRNVIPITLTYAGERFVEEARKILEIKKRLDQELEEISDLKKGRLTIGVSASRGEYWLPDVFPVYRRRFPGIELRIVEGTYSYLEDQVVKGMIDVILTALPFASDEISYEVLTEEVIVLVIPVDHPLVKDKDLSQNSLDNLLYIDPERLAGEKFLNLMPGQGIHRMTAQLFELHGIRPNVILETQSLDTAFKLATRGMGIAFVSDACVEGHFPEYLPALCRIDSQPLKRKAIAGYKKDAYLSHAARAFIDTVREVLASCPEFRKVTHDAFVKARQEALAGSVFDRWFAEICPQEEENAR